MIGGGGKIGGPPRGPMGVEPPQTPAADPKGPTTSKGPVVARPEPRALDRFEKSGGRLTPSQPGAVMSPERSASTDVLKLVRENPGQAKALVASMRAQLERNAAKLQQEMAGARAMLEQLGAARFSKAELDRRRAELRRRREKIAALKLRNQLAARKMALLQQLAGRLGDPGLDEELDRVLSHHEKLQTEWGRRHHLLEIAELFYGADEDTPEHLREVVRADVRAGRLAESVGEAMHDVSPRRVIAELIARTLDGTVPEEGAPASPVGRAGEHGRTLQTWSTLGDLMVAALSQDPFRRE